MSMTFLPGLTGTCMQGMFPQPPPPPPPPPFDAVALLLKIKNNNAIGDDKFFLYQLRHVQLPRI